MSEIASARSTSPKFLHQRKIAYVDNPLDEQASTSCLQSCDLKYMQKNPDYKGYYTKTPSETLVGAVSSSNNNSEDQSEDGGLSLGLSLGTELCQNDWSCLFSPVQCHDNSPSGEIQLSLSYDPFLATLKVAIIKARGLMCSICASKPRNSGIICVGTFISISLFSNIKHLETKKTAMKTRKAEIFFYDRFSFLVKQDVISRCSLQCRAVHKVGSILKRNHVIGQVLIGGENNCDDDGRRHWQAMIGKPRKSITQWYYLKED